MSNPLFSEENQGSFMASISWLIAFFCVLLRDDHARNILCCSGVSSTQSPSAKNCASVMPNPLQMLSSVGMEGVVFRLKILEMVDWESPDSNAEPDIRSIADRPSIPGCEVLHS